MKPLGIGTRLFVAVAVIVIVSGAAISQLVVNHFSLSLWHAATVEARSMAHRLALDAVDKILVNDSVGLHKLLHDQLKANAAVAYLFIYEDDRALAHTFDHGVPVELMAANTPDKDGDPRLEKIVNEKGRRFLDVAWPILDGKAGILRIGLAEDFYREKINALWVRMSLATLAILALALVVSRMVVSHLIRPLVRLADTVAAIDANHLELPVQGKAHAEIKRLEIAFRDMLDRLKTHTGLLETSNLTLARTNAELDRAQRQMRTVLSISRQIAGLATLQEIASHLLRAFRGITNCRHMALLVINRPEQAAVVLSETADPLPLGAEALATANGVFIGLSGISFIEKSGFDGITLPDDMQDARQLAVFPFYHQNERLGAMIIGCPKTCDCVVRELDVIELILNQVSGVLYRAVLHERQIEDLRGRVDPTGRFGDMIGKDPKMQQIYKLIEDVAPTDATVLIQGESGTGKELVAQAIHALSPRSDHPFVVINCAAYPSTLLESELFGHEKGAFTGATRRRIGRFEQAQGGTVLLDEIGEISASAQIKLLRVLQSRKFERLGGEQTLAVDVRILAATNQNLLERVKVGEFREDLFFRLNVVPIEIPPLRTRQNDIPMLARHFLTIFSRRQKKDIQEIGTDTMRRLLSHPWPGNVRELENAIEHAVVLAKGQVVDAADLPAAMLGTGKQDPTAHPTIMENEARLLREVLEQCNWNKTEAAIRLGISRSTLYEKIKKYQIIPPTMH